MKIIIGIVGRIASGKTTVTDYLISKHSAVSFRFSDMLRDVLKRMRLPENRANLQTISSALRQNFGDDIMSKVLAEDVKNSSSRLIITEGVRRPSDIKNLKNLDNFHIVSISADQQTRYDRLTGRKENTDDKDKSWQQFLEQDEKEPEKKIDEIALLADYTIDNNKSMPELFRQVDDIIDKVCK
ncbi:MAG: AAA family ATPase [bacterium]